MLNLTMTINGLSQSIDKLLDFINQAMEEIIVQVPDASKGDVDSAVSAANVAFSNWQNTTREKRNQPVSQQSAQPTADS